MELNLEQAFEGPVDLSNRFDVRAASLDRPELLALSPVEFAGRLERADNGFVLQGRLKIEGEVACSRCLTPVRFSRSPEVSWLFAPAHRRAEVAEEETELGKGELDVVFYDELQLPFDPFIEEQLQLEIPMKPLCREGCRGLCSRCGADLNAGPCGCQDPGDDRWKALRNLVGDRS